MEDETKFNNKQIQKALLDEPLFVVMARDAAAPRTIISWIGESILNQPADKLHAALDTAIKMAEENEAMRKAAIDKTKKDKNFTIQEEF